MTFDVRRNVRAIDKEVVRILRRRCSCSLVGYSTTTLRFYEGLETSKERNGDLEKKHAETEEHLSSEIGKLSLSLVSGYAY